MSYLVFRSVQNFDASEYFIRRDDQRKYSYTLPDSSTKPWESFAIFHRVFGSKDGMASGLYGFRGFEPCHCWYFMPINITTGGIRLRANAQMIIMFIFLSMADFVEYVTNIILIIYPLKGNLQYWKLENLDGGSTYCNICTTSEVANCNITVRYLLFYSVCLIFYMYKRNWNGRYLNAYICIFCITQIFMLFYLYQMKRSTFF